MGNLDWDTPKQHAARRRSYERIRDRHPDFATRGFSCNAGWHGIIADFFDETAAALAAAPESKWELRQIKEKFAGLRIYYNVYLEEPPPMAEAEERFLRVRRKKRKSLATSAAG